MVGDTPCFIGLKCMFFKKYCFKNLSKPCFFYVPSSVVFSCQIVLLRLLESAEPKCCRALNVRETERAPQLFSSQQRPHPKRNKGRGWQTVPRNDEKSIPNIWHINLLEARLRHIGLVGVLAVDVPICVGISTFLGTQSRDLRHHARRDVDLLLPMQIRVRLHAGLHVVTTALRSAVLALDPAPQRR